MTHDTFIEHDGETILNLPWGAVGVINTLLDYHDELHVLDRIRPRDALFDILPEARALAFRMVSADVEVTFGRHYVEALEADEAHDVLIVGHEHVAREVPLSSKRLLATSCLRNEYLVDRTTKALTPCKKHVAEVRMRAGQAVDARLVAVEMPCEVPSDLEAVRPAILRSLESIEPAPDLLSTLVVAASKLAAPRRPGDTLTVSGWGSTRSGWIPRLVPHATTTLPDGSG